MAIAAIERLTPKGVLAELRECDQAEREIGARRLWLATVWADQHPAIRELPFTAPVKESLLDDGPIGVAAAAVAEFAAVIGVSTDSGARLPRRRSRTPGHIIPWDSGGETSTDNLACLCRKHHRLKTHTSWRYRTMGPAEYLWTSPHCYQFLRTAGGTAGLPPPTG
jgi:hypothetical protein